MAFTVTATQSGSSSNRGVFLLVRVLTNAAEAGGATSGANNTSGIVASGSLTPNFSSSWVGFSVAEDGVTTGLNAAASNNVYDYTNADTTDGWSSAQGHYTGTVTAGTPLTYGEGTFANGDHSNWCAYEVKTAGGTIGIDGSSPAGVNTQTLTAITTASFTPPGGAVLVALVTCGGNGSGTGITCTITDTSGLGLTWTRRAISSTSDNFQPCFIFTATMPGGVAPFTRSAVAETSRTWQRRWTRTVRPNIPPQVQSVTVLAGLASATGAAPALSFNPYISGLASGTGASYWQSNTSNPRMWIGDEIWALFTNAGRWNSGNYQSTFDTYFSTRAAQGFTICYSDAFNSTFIGGAANGQMWNGQTPFNSNNPSSGLNGSYWAVIDYALNSALSNGITVALSLGGHWDWDTSGNAMFGFTGTQYTDAGNAIGTRYKNQPNLVWMIMDDYFGSFDSSLTSFLTGLRNSGDTHVIAIENMSESSSRFTLDTSTSLTWGASNTQYNFGYSYSCTYLCIEYMFGEASPLTPIYGDGYFYQGGSTYAGGSGAGALDRAMRQDGWWAVTSGARGFNMGDEALWQWASSAPGVISTQWYAANNIGNIRALMESLPGWQTLVPDTSSVLVTGGRGTRGSQLASGGGGGQYEPATSNSFVSASRTPDGGSGSQLAVMYLPNSTTITIDQTKMGAGYQAWWVDPVSGAKTSTTAGSTYNSTAKGNNSKGDPDWVLVLQVPNSVTANAGLATGTGAALSPSVAETDSGGTASVTGTALNPAASLTVTDTLATGTGAAPSPVAVVTVLAGLATGAGTALNATVSTSSGATAPAQLATGTGAAQGASAAETDSGGNAQVAGSALNPGASLAVTPSDGAAPGAGAALSPLAQVTVLAGLAASSGAALNPAISTSGNNVTAIGAIASAAALAPLAITAANAGLAAAMGAALSPGPARTPGQPSGAGAALSPAAAVTVLAGLATATGTAVPLPPPFSTARSTSTVTDPRDGTKSVTAAATSTSGVT